ncbi:hypothetical protein BDW62DRAFT_24027 [Aspergillus aurantiobrunneus]
MLKRHMNAFCGELLVTWQADTLTRLIEVIYERHGWRMPGEILVGDHDNLDRNTLSKIYVMAAKKIKKETITKKAVGLSEQYYLALQRLSIYVARILFERSLTSRGGSSRKSRPGQGCTVSGEGCFLCAIVELSRRVLTCSKAPSWWTTGDARGASERVAPLKR